MTAVPHNFIVEKGATVSWTLSSTDIDFTGHTVELDVRDSPGSSTTLFTMTAGNGRVSIAGGAVTFTIASSDSAALTFDRGVYDIKDTDGSGLSNFLLTGNFIVRGTVTR